MAYWLETKKRFHLEFKNLKLTNQQLSLKDEFGPFSHATHKLQARLLWGKSF